MYQADSKSGPSEQAACYLLVSCLAYSSILKIEGTYSSETSVDFQLMERSSKHQIRYLWDLNIGTGSTLSESHYLVTDIRTANHESRFSTAYLSLSSPTQQQESQKVTHLSCVVDTLTT
jgi:hypothetical protein